MHQYFSSKLKLAGGPANSNDTAHGLQLHTTGSCAAIDKSVRTQKPLSSLSLVQLPFLWSSETQGTSVTSLFWKMTNVKHFQLKARQHSMALGG